MKTESSKFGKTVTINGIDVNPTGYQTVLYVTIALYIVALLLSMFFVDKTKNVSKGAVDH